MWVGWSARGNKFHHGFGWSWLLLDWCRWRYRQFRDDNGQCGRIVRIEHRSGSSNRRWYTCWLWYCRRHGLWCWGLGHDDRRSGYRWRERNKYRWRRDWWRNESRNAVLIIRSEKPNLIVDTFRLEKSKGGWNWVSISFDGLSPVKDSQIPINPRPRGTYSLFEAVFGLPRSRILGTPRPLRPSSISIPNARNP